MPTNPFFKKPLGPSELGDYLGKNWNNLHMGADGPITCEICGTNHPERKDETYIISIFLGRQVVEECCGAIIDKVFKESSELLFSFLQTKNYLTSHAIARRMRHLLRFCNLRRTASKSNFDAVRKPMDKTSYSFFTFFCFFVQYK